MAVPVAGFLLVDIGAAAPVMPLGLSPEQVDSRPKVERQECPLEIVLVNGRRLLLPLTVSPALVKELAEVLEGVRSALRPDEGLAGRGMDGYAQGF